MAKTHAAIQTITTVGGEASITFNNIPQNYTDLKLIISARDTNTPGNTDDGLFIQFNGVASGYSNKVLYGNGSSALSASNSYGLTSKSYVGAICTGSATSNTFGNAEIYIPNYTSSNYKSISSDTVLESNGTQVITALNTSLWSNSAAITIINISTNGYTFAANSTFTLYGIGSGAKAVGGYISGMGNYIYHAFAASGTFQPTESIKNAEILCVAGGGGAGSRGGGGGGAGGLLWIPNQTLNAGTNYSVIVGSGGTGETQSSTGGQGTSGTNSIFGSLSPAIGGGYGGGEGTNGGNGGSGGGGGSSSSGTTGGTGTSGQGNNGGSSSSVNNSAAGGGGFGAAGSASTNTVGGAGGVGALSYVTWANATQAGYPTGNYINQTWMLAFGGGGGSEYSPSGVGGPGGTGTSGGLGDGSGGLTTTSAGSSGISNSGGGGGGGGASAGVGYAGGNGGSGVVIVRYPIN